MALGRHHRQAGLLQARLQERRVGLVARALFLALLQVAHAGQRPRRHRRRQRRGEDEARGIGAHEVHQRRRAGDVAAQHAISLGQRPLDHRHAVHHSLALGNAPAARPVKTNRVHLVQIGHRPVTLGHLAKLGDRRDIPVHRIDRLEGHQLRPIRRLRRQTTRQVLRVVVLKNLLFRPAVPNALDHRGVVQLVRQDQTIRQAARQGPQAREVRHVARGEQQRRLLAVQVGQLALQQHVIVVGARDVARPAGPRATARDRPVHRLDHLRVLTHPEIVVRTPHRDLPRPLALVTLRARKPARRALQVRKHPVATLTA